MAVESSVFVSCFTFLSNYLNVCVLVPDKSYILLRKSLDCKCPVMIRRLMFAR